MAPFYPVDTIANDLQYHIPIASEEERMLAALEEKRLNPSTTFIDLSTRYAVPYSTLKHRFNGRLSKAEYSAAMQRLSPPEEDAIVRWIEQLIDWGFPPTVSQLTDLTNSLLHDRGDSSSVHYGWHADFLERHPKFKLKWSKALDACRKDAHSEEIVTRWFDLYKETVDKYNIKQENQWNMDEKGFAMGVLNSQKVVCLKSDLKKYALQPGSREWVSLIEAVSAIGKKLSIYCIFSAKHPKLDWMDELQNPELVTVKVTQNGWTDVETGFHWLQHTFEPQTRPDSEDDYRLLLLDGHNSHVSENFVEFCWEKKIVPLCLPPHSTHLLQPLDVGVFLPLAMAYKARLREQCRFKAVNITKKRFLKLLEEAREEAMTVEHISSAWRKAGLQPLDPGVVLQKAELQRPYTPPEVQNGGSIAPDTATKGLNALGRVLKGEGSMEDLRSTTECLLKLRADRRCKQKLIDDMHVANSRRKTKKNEAGLIKDGTVLTRDVIAAQRAKKKAVEDLKAAKKAEKDAISELKNWANLVWAELPITAALIKALQ